MPRPTPPRNHSGLITLLWCLLQGTNIFIAAIAAQTAGIMTTEFLNPAMVSTFLLFYLTGRTLNYGLIHLLGYHAAAALDDIGGSASSRPSVSLPDFQRSSTHFKHIYHQRAKGHQLLYQTGFILMESGVTWATTALFNHFFPAGSARIWVWLGCWLIVLIAWTIGYETYFPKVFRLNVLMTEHGQPVFIRRGVPLPRIPDNMRADD
ncbi:hypothetical protein [Lacticaseibacillus mingshuiensis]|nr:hypothetical protein [Lacticaseibacillus mingshuiensis]